MLCAIGGLCAAEPILVSALVFLAPLVLFRISSSSLGAPTTGVLRACFGDLSLLVAMMVLVEVVES